MDERLNIRRSKVFTIKFVNQFSSMVKQRLIAPNAFKITLRSIRCNHGKFTLVKILYQYISTGKHFNFDKINRR